MFPIQQKISSETARKACPDTNQNTLKTAHSEKKYFKKALDKLGKI